MAGSPSPSTLAAWIPAVLRCLKHYGLQKSDALSLAGIDQTKLFEADARYSIYDTHRLMQLVQQHVTSPAPGIELAKFADQSSFGALGYALSASHDLEEALSRLVRFSPVISSVVGFQNRRIHQWRDPQTQVAIEQALELEVMEGQRASDTSVATFDFCLAVITHFLRIKGGSGANPKQVYLKQAVDDKTQAYYQAFFGAPVVGSADKCALILDLSTIPKNLMSPVSPEMRSSFDTILEASLIKLDSAPLSAHVLERIMAALPNGEPSLAEIASGLNISGRTLQRKLKDEHTQFKTLLDEGRKNLSQRYLTIKQYSVTETAFLLGFSDVSSFSRAHRRWFGRPPSGA